MFKLWGILILSSPFVSRTGRGQLRAEVTAAMTSFSVLKPGAPGCPYMRLYSS